MSYMKEKSFSFKAEAAIAKYKFVKFGTNAQEIDVAGAGEGFGAAMSDADIGSFAEVAMIGGGAKIECGGTIAKGAMVSSDASGNGITTASAGDLVLGIAQEAGVVGDIISIERVYLFRHA